MRGFRGSRAAQSFNSRFERHYERKMQQESFHRMVEQQQQPKEHKVLPNWLKGLEQQPQPAPKKMSEKPSNVVPITQAKKRVTATKSSNKRPPSSKAAITKRKAA